MKKLKILGNALWECGIGFTINFEDKVIKIPIPIVKDNEIILDGQEVEIIVDERGKLLILPLEC